MRRSKIRLDPIVKSHYQTLRDETGKIPRSDFAQHFIIPLSSGSIIGAIGAEISMPTSIALLTLAGIFAAFFFQLGVQLLERAASWADEGPDPGPNTSRYAMLLEELSANSTYASLIAALSAILTLIAGIISGGWYGQTAAALAVMILAHLAVTLLYVISRVFLLTRARLIAVRTGSETSSP